MKTIIPFIIVIGVLSLITYILWKRRASEVSELHISGSNSLDKLAKIVSKDSTEIIKIDRGLVYKDVEYEASRKNKETVAKAFKKCVYGEENAKRITMSTYRDIIAKHLPTVEECNKIIDFKHMELLTPEQKFEIIIYELRKIHGKNVMKYLNEIYKFSDEKEMPDAERPRREVNYQMIDQIFEEQIKYKELNYEQALDMITIFVYQILKGFGKIETLRELNIDGFEIGTSGAIRYRLLGTNPKHVIERSCWIQLDAKWIHLSFIDFGSEDEIKRLVINMTNVEGSESLTLKKPLKVVDNYKGDRLTAIRPDVGATWGLFVRSFSAGIVRVPQWLNKEGIHNWELVDRLLYFLAKSYQNVAFTGQQNTGKTTLMKGYIDYYDYINIRVLEMSFELNLNEIYTDRNIFSTKPTEFISSTEIQDILKKTDGFLSMVGEIAEDIVAANAMKFGLVASASTIFSHHGIDYRGLIDGLTGSLLSCGMYKDYDIAQQLVLDVVKHNVHLNFHKKYRIIEYIEEIVKGEVIKAYPKIKNSNTIIEAIDQSTSVNREYYERRTDRVRYDRREIIRFNKKTMTYEAAQWYSESRFEEILNKLPDNEKPAFIEFATTNWAHCFKDMKGVS
jgi:pilus assembly protein CpaF